MRLGLILGEAASGLRRNLSMVVSVVLVTFISLTFVGASILMQMQIGQMKDYWNDRAQVIVYMCTEIDTTGNCTLVEATDDQIDAVRQQLESATLAPYINELEFENHEQAFENFSKQFADTAFDGIITPESLPENFRVNLVDPEQADVLIESLTGFAGVESVKDQRAYLQPIFAMLNAASYTAIGVAGLMLVAAVLLIATTIRLSAFSRRRELGIMRLVGASNRFIQTPFIVEGVFASLIGSVLASAAIVAIVKFFVSGYLATTLPIATPLLGMTEGLLVVPILIGVGAGLAALSAGVAISRYLKV